MIQGGLTSVISNVIESYKTFLMVKYPSHHTLFCNRLCNKPESAKAEAVLFSLLRTAVDDVAVAEDVVTGGADFLCSKDDAKFIVEVTSLAGEAVAGQSGWPNGVPEDSTAGSFGLITHMLRTRASEKVPQLAGYEMPRVLAISCEHVASDVLLGPLGAEAFLTSDTKIAVPLYTDEASNKGIHLTTDLKNSVFFRFNNGLVEPCRQSISVVLLVSIFADKALVVGILHPVPQHAFSIRLLPTVPFLRMKKWPPEGRGIETEWVVYSPKPAEFVHHEVVFRDKELKRI
jgi:hypothetical protein